MSERDYYPAGAYDDPNAPYNQVPIPERDFDIEVTEYMTRNVTVTTDNYQPEYDDETGHVYTDTTFTDWDKVYKDNDHMSIQELFGEMGVLMQEFFDEIDKTIKLNLPTTSDRKELVKKRNKLHRLLEETKGWKTEETIIIY